MGNETKTRKPGVMILIESHKTLSEITEPVVGKKCVVTQKGI